MIGAELLRPRAERIRQLTVDQVRAAPLPDDAVARRAAQRVEHERRAAHRELHRSAHVIQRCCERRPPRRHRARRLFLVGEARAVADGQNVAVGHQLLDQLLVAPERLRADVVVPGRRPDDARRDRRPQRARATAPVVAARPHA